MIKKMTLAQSENFMIKFFKDAYAKGDIKIIIDRVKITYECFLQCGLDVATISKQLFDFGLREEDNAMGIIQGILKVPDSKLCELDKQIKQKSIQAQGKMLLALYEETLKGKKI